MYTNNYILSIQQQDNSFKTVTFDESVLGWTSRLSYKPKYMFSIGANFYSINDTTNLVTNTTNTLYRHYTNFNNINNSYGLFYGEVFDSTVQVVLNSNPSVIKNFKAINYEGSLGWTMNSMQTSSGDTALAISAYTAPTTLQQFTDDLFSNEFKAKENKYFANYKLFFLESLKKQQIDNIYFISLERKEEIFINSVIDNKKCLNFEKINKILTKLIFKNCKI